jgi:hypothetical protein
MADEEGEDECDCDDDDDDDDDDDQYGLVFVVTFLHKLSSLESQNCIADDDGDDDEDEECCVLNRSCIK